MNFYRVYLLDKQGTSVGLRGFQSEDDESAKRHAFLMSKGQDWALWRDGELIAESSSTASENGFPSKAPSRVVSYRILFVDDNQDFLEPAMAALCADGHIVRATSKGGDLFRLIDLLDPDILITDVIMPDADMLDTIQTLRWTRAGLKIIAISGNPHLLSLASKRGAAHVLAKPFSLGQLRVLIKVAMQ